MFSLCDCDFRLLTNRLTMSIEMASYPIEKSHILSKPNSVFLFSKRLKHDADKIGAELKKPEASLKKVTYKNV